VVGWIVGYGLIALSGSKGEPVQRARRLAVGAGAAVGAATGAMAAARCDREDGASAARVRGLVPTALRWGPPGADALVPGSGGVLEGAPRQHGSETGAGT
jgi:hypothetical protein